MNHQDEVEMGNLQCYLERVQNGKVSGAEPFHTITFLLNKMPECLIEEARELLDSQSPAVFPRRFDDLIRDASPDSMAEVSRLFAEERLCQLGEIDRNDQERRPHCHDRHLRLIEGMGESDATERHTGHISLAT